MKNSNVLYNIVVSLFFAVLIFPNISIAEEHDLQSPRFVNLTWLEKHIGDDNIVVLDARLDSMCKKSHLKKAKCLDMAITYDSYLTAPIPMIQNLLQSRGLNKDQHIITYDDGNLFRAARVAWVLESAGFKKVSILNSSYANWKAAGLAISNDNPTSKKSSIIPTVNPNTVTSLTQTMLAIKNPKTHIIDVRSKAEYLGNYVDIGQAKRYNVSRPESVRRGHIKSAINIPWSVNLIGFQKGLKSIEGLQAQYSSLKKESNIILYCTAGDGSALTYAVLKELGYKPTIYDGGWFEWSAKTTLPIGPIKTTTNN